MHRLKYGLPSTHWMNSSWWSFDCISSLFSIFFLILRNTSTRDFEENIFKNFLPAVFCAQDADTKGERANKPVRTKAPINGWNLKDKADKSFQKACSRILLLRTNWRFFFPVEFAQAFGCPFELESWGQFQYDIGFHSLKIASYTVAGPTFIPKVRFLFCCEANMKTPWYYWIFSTSQWICPIFFPKWSG